MDIVFAEERDKFVVIYLDDVAVYSKSDSNYMRHLRHIFTKCRRFSIFLNPKKLIFALSRGKLLGHVVSKEGISIDPKRVAAIQKLEYPRRKKEVQSFLGRVNFLMRVVSNFVEIVKAITNMLRKENHIFWTTEEKVSFN